MKMQVAIVLYPGMTALDAIGPYEVLRYLPGSEIRFLHHAVGPVMTDSGVLTLGASHTFEQTPAPDLLLVPGSESDTGSAAADAKLLAWLRNAHLTTRWTTSVCSGAVVLAAAGLLKGLPATTHWAAQGWLGKLGAIPQRDQRVVRSGKIVTAAGVSAGIDLALFLLGQISGRERAEVAQLMIEYDPQPPFDAGHPSKAAPRVFELAKAELKQRSSNPKVAPAAVPRIVRRPPA